METIALAANCGVDAVLLVLDAFRYAQAISGKGSAPSQEHIAPRALCSGFRRFVRHYFNDNEEGKELLSEWGIKQSEDLGRIVFAMVEAGWMKASLDDAISQFAGLFTLDTLFPNPG